jgi:hypothetical protein
MYVTDYLNRTVKFIAPLKNPAPFFFLGSWKKFNNTIGKVSPHLDGNSIADDRVPVFFDDYRLNIPVKYLHILNEHDMESTYQFLTIANYKHAHWICHLRNNFKMLNIQLKRLNICAADKQVRLLSRRLGLSIASWIKPPPLESNIASFGSNLFRKISLFKQKCLWGMLDIMSEGESFVFLDSDVTLLKIPVLSGYDIEIMDDSPPLALSTELNIGFFILRNTYATRMLKKVYLNYLHQNSGLNDQKLINDIIRSYSKRLGLNINTLNPRMYINGYRYYEDVYAIFNIDNAVAIHHNWISGDEFKWERTVKWNAIVSNDYHSQKVFNKKMNDTWFSTPRFVYKHNVRKSKVNKLVC